MEIGLVIILVSILVSLVIIVESKVEQEARRERQEILRALYVTKESLSSQLEQLRCLQAQQKLAYKLLGEDKERGILLLKKEDGE